MGRKGSRHQLKRLASPGFWPIPRKEKVWVVKPSPGPYPIKRSVPLLVVLRDGLGFAHTVKEAKRIIAEGKVKIDGKVVTDIKIPVGFMDVVEVSGLNIAYRAVPSVQRLMKLQPISENEKSFKLCRIEGKMMLKAGSIQFNLHDGSNLLVKPEEDGEESERSYSVLDVVKLDLASRGIVGHFKFEPGMYALIVGGKNIGRHGTVTEVEKVEYKSRKLSNVKIKEADGTEYSTMHGYVFVVGRESSAVSLPGG